MRRLLLVLPVAGAMMTASLAFAQTSAPATTAQTEDRPAGSDTAASDREAPPAARDEARPKRGGCVNLSGVAPSGSADEMQAALAENGNEAAPQGTGEREAAAETRPASGANAGTAPGGSDIGTSQSEEPRQEHPAMASGLDPISGETAFERPQATTEPGKDAAARTDC